MVEVTVVAIGTARCMFIGAIALSYKKDQELGKNQLELILL
jgi:hypothetical protein